MANGLFDLDLSGCILGNIFFRGFSNCLWVGTICRRE